MAQPSLSAAEMPKLLFVTKYIDHILSFFLERLSQDFELTIVVDMKNRWTGRLVSAGIELHHLEPRSKFDRSFRDGVEALRGGREFDLVQCFHGNSQLSNLIRWNARRSPLIAYRARIGHLKFRENPTAYWNARNPTLTAVAAVSSAVKAYLESFRFLKAPNVHVLHHGINRPWVESEIASPYGLREALGIDPDALIVASLAALRPVKRFDYVVHAAEALQKEPVHFVHIGEPKGWDRKTAHLENVHFIGRQTEPLPMLADADVFAMTSHNEAFGRANIEAMACGLPVIGSNTGGLLDIVEPGETGQLFESSSPDAFADAVRSYLSDRGAVARHGQNAIARVDRLFSTEKMAEGYRNLYIDILARQDATA